MASAGNAPDRTQVTSEINSVKPKTRQSSDTSATGKKRQCPDADAGRAADTGEQPVFKPQLSLNLPARRAK